MSTGAAPDLDAESIIAWVAAVQGVVMPHTVAQIAAEELRAAAGTLRGLDDAGPMEQPDFMDVLEAHAEDAA